MGGILGTTGMTTGNAGYTGGTTTGSTTGMVTGNTGYIGGGTTTGSTTGNSIRGGTTTGSTTGRTTGNTGSTGLVSGQGGMYGGEYGKPGTNRFVIVDADSVNADSVDA